jgi:predicted Fe-S protein YdhL (DUF1289 family)
MSERVQPDREAIESPCIDICVIDEQSGLCEGCGRTLDEIAEWGAYTPAERRRIIAELGQRDYPHAGA